MPELPEVETTRRGIHPYVEGHTITGVTVRNGKLRWPVPVDIDKTLIGQRIHKLSRRAKYLLFQCDNGSLLLHLGMSGRLRVLDEDIVAEKHDHIDICFDNGYILRFNDPRRFGALLWTDKPVNEHALLAHLGPEPLSADFTAEYLLKQAAKRHTAIKTFIMNGEIVVGVGNIYANEALFLAGIHPETSSKTINKREAEKLVAAIKLVLEKAIEAGGTTLRDFRKSDGKPGYFAQELNVYGRKGLPCPHCQREIELIKQSQRATYFCPHCQQAA